MSGFFESKSLKRSEFNPPQRCRDEKRCLRHNDTMDLQVCDRIRRDLTSSSSSPANKSMMYSKISSGSVSIVIITTVTVTTFKLITRSRSQPDFLLNRPAINFGAVLKINK